MAEPKTSVWVWVGDVLAATTGVVLGGKYARQQGQGQPTRQKGSLLAGLLKAKLPDAEHNAARAWVDGLDMFAKMRMEATYTNDEIAEIFKRPSSQWNSFIPTSIVSRVEAVLPHIDARTAEQIRQTFGGAVRRQERRARGRRFDKVVLKFILVLTILFILIVVFPDATPFGYQLVRWLKTLGG